MWNHHHAVKYHQLIPQADKSLTNRVSLNDNLIIHGDNLKALKALLPNYAGKVKCIYIDPPYNTGNDKWVYSDSVNSPLIQDWLGKVVDLEDLCRHEKWLCMMTPRLKLLKELLSEDGVIFVSIDDNEQHHLRLLMDEIFGPHNFIALVAAQLNPRGRTLDKFFAKTHEYIIVYGKTGISDTVKQLNKEGKALEEYNKSDERGKYREIELRNRNPVFNRHNRPKLFFPIYVNPETSEISLHKLKKFSGEALPLNSRGEEGCWRWSKQKVQANLDVLIGKHTRTGMWRIFMKDYLQDQNGAISTTKPKTLWLDHELNNENGKEVFREIFGRHIFDFPKSVDLIKKCVELGTGHNSIVLDSFAGSGTTAHAVLELNKEDGGNRKFILVEMEDYADEITAERVRRVIKGVPGAHADKLRQGLGGAFSYFELGPPIEMESILQGMDLPSFEELARYVFYTATGEDFDPAAIDEGRFFIGESHGYQVYLLYQPDLNYLKQASLNLTFAESLEAYKGKVRLVFAPVSFLDEDYLDRYRIEFCQLPFEIYRFKE